MNESKTFEPGSTIAGRFRIQRVLGAGGCGTVYLANDENGPAEAGPVAVKVVRPELCASDGDKEQFVRALHYVHENPHPNLVEVKELAALPNGQLVIVSEYIEGETLEDRIQKAAPVHPREALYTLLHLCQGVAHLHKQQITHGYLKPGNVLIGADGSIKIADVGFGEPLLARANFTNPRGFFGDPFYLAPEQIEEHRTNIRSDVYAIGVILYELLTGKVPFEGRSLTDIVARIIRGAPIKQSSETIASIAGDAPGYLVRTVMNAIQRDPMNRFPTVTEMFARIEPYIEAGDAERRKAYIDIRNAPPEPRVRRERSTVVPKGMFYKFQDPGFRFRVTLGGALFLVVMVVLYGMGQKNRAALDSYGQQRAKEITRDLNALKDVAKGTGSLLTPGR